MLNKIYISKQNLIKNLKQVKQNNPKSLICAMVKANAYGVGLKEVVQTLGDDVDYFGVACFFEACEVNKHTNKKILIVGPLGREVDINLTFSYTCACLDDVEYLLSKNLPINIHIKINSGMNRFGFKSLSEFKKALTIISNSKLKLEGLFTHFATADSFVDVQYKNFLRFVNICHKNNMFPLIHADNSAVSVVRNHKLDMVRVGYNLYLNNEQGFDSVVEITSTVQQINKVKAGELVGYNYRCVAKNGMRVAVLPMGYADGFCLGFCGLEIFVGKTKCKILNVCMDCFMLDVTKTKIKKGDEIYVINKFNPLTRYAEYIKSSSYEISTNFSRLRAGRLLVPTFKR